MPSVDTQGGYRVTRANAVEKPAETQEEAESASPRHRRAARRMDEE